MPKIMGIACVPGLPEKAPFNLNVGISSFLFCVWGGGEVGGGGAGEVGEGARGGEGAAVSMLICTKYFMIVLYRSLHCGNSDTLPKGKFPRLSCRDKVCVPFEAPLN